VDINEEPNPILESLEAPAALELTAEPAKSHRSLFAFLRPSATHSAYSATLLLMLSTVLSGVLALVRIKYINYLFGAGVAQDAYRAAFKLPDLLAYFLIGGAASISLITVLNRYREAGDEEGGDRALSVILTTMLIVLGIGVLLAEIFAPQYVRLANKGFRDDAAKAALCTTMTRLIIPAQLFLFIGSVMSSRLQVRKIFLYQAFTPLIYNAGIILGAVFLHRQLGVTSLAVGVLVGMFIGSAVLNSVGALRTGLRYRPIIGFRDPAFLEWLKLSLPLMIGVSLVMFDGIFLNYYASLRNGGITLIGNAKDLFNAPFNVIGPAAGAASLPFFASLFQQRRAHDFSASVGRSVSRLFSVGMIVSAWMIALAPWLMDLFRGGKFNHADAAGTTHLFSVLAERCGPCTEKLSTMKRASSVRYRASKTASSSATGCSPGRSAAKTESCDSSRPRHACRSGDGGASHPAIRQWLAPASASMSSRRNRCAPASQLSLPVASSTRNGS
jgi:putative peptidoglycan lipid II flippase